MDDPWGSPWATNDTVSRLEPRLPASTLELPGRSLTRQRSFTTGSPWASEDDGLGEWSAADSSLALPPSAATPGSLWSAWGDNSPNSSQQHLATPRAREGSFGQHSSIAWPAATSSPGIPQAKTLSRRSSTRSLFRQPSPDPWATEVSQNRLSLPSPAHLSAEQTAFSTLDRHEEEEEEDGFPTIEEEQTKEKHTPEPQVRQGAEAEAVTQADERAAEKEDDNESHQKSPSASRHSSISDYSRHDERQDSPITSMDEDSKDNPQIPRRLSAEVQEVVDTYDGIAKNKEEVLLVPPSTSGRWRSTSRGATSIRSARTDDVSDFGDFEDAESFVEPAIPSRQPSVSGSPRPTSRAGRPRSTSKMSLRGPTASSIAMAPAIAEEPSNKFQELRSKFGTVKFTPDLESVDKLFDVAKLDKEQPSAKDYSLDTIDRIIKDSFTSVSERKTWYRISRPGPMRKHDLGDDDNYRRVTWAHSKAREETAKIVRRWMGEDSYSGPLPFGGGGPSVKGGGGFNWDTKAEPLSMDQVFGKRKSVQPPRAVPAAVPRPLSLQPQSAAAHSRTASTDVKSLPPRSPLSIPGPPSPAVFGWTTVTNASATPASSRPASIRQSLEVSSIISVAAKEAAASDDETESRDSFQIAPPSPAPAPAPESPQTLKDPTPSVDDDDDDNDDDWGEMVVSPPATSRPDSGFFDNASINGSINGNPTDNPAAPAPTAVPDTPATLDAVSSKLQQGSSGGVKEKQPAAAALSANIWDFSAFDDTKPAAPAIPPATTSKPEFDFDTPLQSPALSGPSKTASPVAAFQLPKPPTPTLAFRPHHTPKSSLDVSIQSPFSTGHARTPSSSSLSLPKPPSPFSPSQPRPARKPSHGSPSTTVSSRTTSPVSFQLPKPPTPTIASQAYHAQKTSLGSSTVMLPPAKPPTPPVPFRPQHGQRPSLSLGRPSPLQNVMTSKVASSLPGTPTIPPPKSVSFVQGDEESLAVRRIVDGLPGLSYMLR